jgi:hypothetical protein
VAELRDAGLEVGAVAGLADAPRRTVLPGDAGTAVKDPVVAWHDGRWPLWASVPPLDVPDPEDRMTTEHATSPTASTGRGGGPRWAAAYDDRATAAENRGNAPAGPSPPRCVSPRGEPAGPGFSGVELSPGARPPRAGFDLGPTPLV